MTPAFDPYDARGTPLVVEAGADRDPSRIAGMRPWVESVLPKAGAVLLRGFDVGDAPAFGRVAASLSDALERDYLGTSPRDEVAPGVFTASELPGHYPIPQHCEMTFIKNPPRRLFFGCLTAPAIGSGETPIADQRRVLADLPDALVQRAERLGFRIVRNYAGPSTLASKWNPWQLKRWDQLFGTTEREAVAARARSEGFEPTWFGEDGLRLVSFQPAVRAHPVTGDRAWFNHLATFHPQQAVGEYRRIAAMRPTLRNHAVLALARTLSWAQRGVPGDDRAMNVTWGDGSPIDDATVDTVRESTWRNLVVIPWQRGDVLAIDNRIVSHGRLPYRGPRLVVVSWMA